MFPPSKKTHQSQTVSQMHDYVKQSQQEKSKNAWLQRAENQTISTKNTRELATNKLRQKDVLETRRQNLKKLITIEENMFEKELKSIQKTPDQVVEEMRQKVGRLKEENEKGRMEEVKILRTMQLKNNEESLKMMSKKASEVRTQIEREFQVRERRDIIGQLNEEEQVFAHLSKLQIRDKILEERKMKEEKMEKVKTQNEILRKQLEDIKELKKKELGDLEMENQNFRDVCRRLVVDEKQKLEKQRELNRKLAGEVRVFNEFQKIEKDEKTKQQNETDKILLEAQLERERMLGILEEVQKEKYKKETREFLKQIKARTDEVKLNQQLVDQLINEEIELQWKKRQEVWEREEKARVKLLRAVYAQRFENIEEKKQRKRDELREMEREKFEAEKVLEDFKKSEKQGFLDELAKMSMFRNSITDQIQKKFQLDQRDKFKEIEEERKRHLQELEYAQAVEEEMKKGQMLIEEIQKLREIV